MKKTLTLVAGLLLAASQLQLVAQFNGGPLEFSYQPVRDWKETSVTAISARTLQPQTKTVWVPPYARKFSHQPHAGWRPETHVFGEAPGMYQTIWLEPIRVGVFSPRYLTTIPADTGMILPPPAPIRLRIFASPWEGDTLNVPTKNPWGSSGVAVLPIEGRCGRDTTTLQPETWRGEIEYPPVRSIGTEKLQQKMLDLGLFPNGATYAPGYWDPWTNYLAFGYYLWRAEVTGNKKFYWHLAERCAEWGARHKASNSLFAQLMRTKLEGATKKGAKYGKPVAPNHQVHQ